MNGGKWKSGAVLVVGAVGMAMYANSGKANEGILGWNFTAPNVSAPSGGGVSNLPTIINDPKGGDIVYDYTSNQFFGYGTNPSGAWQALSAGVGALVPTGTILPCRNECAVGVFAV